MVSSGIESSTIAQYTVKMTEISTDGDSVHLYFTSTKPITNATLKLCFFTCPVTAIEPFIDKWYEGWHFLNLFWFKIRRRTNRHTNEETSEIINVGDFASRTASFETTKTGVTIANTLEITDEVYANYAKFDSYGCQYAIMINGVTVGAGTFQRLSR